MDTPVLLIGFNRPNMITQAISCISAVKPAKLYVAIDGPRENIVTDLSLLNQVKELVNNLNWSCKVRYKFNKENLGAEITVSSAVSWVLESEENVIVMEDDIIASKSFFQFCEEMLKMYKDQENIYMISGGQITPVNLPNNEDYLLGLYGHTGAGWATWRRAWIKFDLYVDRYEKYRTGKLIKEVVYSKAEEYFMGDLIRKMDQNGVGKNTWDSCWFFIRFDELGLSIIPRINLTTDIGIYGLHAKGKTEYHYRKYDKEFVVHNHPKIVARNHEYDTYHVKHLLYRKNICIEMVRRSGMYKLLKKIVHGNMRKLKGKNGR